MSSLLINDLKNNSSQKDIKITIQQQANILGGGEEGTTIIFIGLKPILSKWPIILVPPSTYS